MATVTATQTLSLVKTDQKKVSKKAEQLKKKIITGEIEVEEIPKKKHVRKAKTRGLIYIGHLPHGFYEVELKKYFSQFGKVTNVKVCRSRANGNSKGYGYVEFLHDEVAKIAAETMNNYIMFKKRVVSDYVPLEKRPKYIFVGKQTTAKAFPALKKRQRQTDAKDKEIDEETHLKQAKTRMTRLQKRMEILKKHGVTYNIKALDVPKALTPKKSKK